jgi:hypothetical protein
MTTDAGRVLKWRSWSPKTGSIGCLIPQHGPGPKHERRIVLEEWQERIVTAHPMGLVSSTAGDGGAVTDHLGTDPESQAARGLTPDEQRAERERESREMEETKLQQAVEDDQAEREKLVQRIGQPLEPRDDE